ncbi:MAG: SH3 domain-containing protein [Parvibaculaceae bacterium]
MKTALGAVALALGVAAASPAFAAEAYTATDLNVRTGPGTQYERIATLPPDTGVDVIDSENGWCLVRARGLRGWVSCNYLARGEEPTNVIVLRPEIYIGPGHYYRPHH